MPAPLRRVARMDRGELRFRLACECAQGAWAYAVDAGPPALAPRGSDRHPRPGALFQQSGAGGDPAGRPRRRLAAAHIGRSPRTLRHVRPLFRSIRTWRAAASTRIRERFPRAAAESAARAESIIAGHYDILGYRDVPFGRPPRWNHDPVHDRTAPQGFWAAVPYLDPASGDHKIIWEMNRHQHWLALGRAFSHVRPAVRREFVTQLEDWLPANPPLTGVNWASMLELGSAPSPGCGRSILCGRRQSKRSSPLDRRSASSASIGNSPTSSRISPATSVPTRT